MSWYFVFLATFMYTTSFENVLQETCPEWVPCNNGNTSKLIRPSRDFMSVPNNGQKSCCFPCSCDTSICKLRKNCCPSLQNTGTTTTTITPVTNTSELEGENHENMLNQRFMLETACVPTSINMDRKHLEVNETKEWSARHLHLGVFMVSECPVGMNDTRCTLPDVNNMDEMIPQTDADGITYRNVYCASCNNVTNTTRWKVYVTCSHINIYKADDLLFPNTVEKMYKFAVTTDLPTCGIEFLPPDNVNMTTSICVAENEKVVSGCNGTTANQSLIDACRDVKIPYVHSNRDGLTVYANVFCFMCSVQTVPRPVCPHSVGLSFYHNNKFVAELNIDGVDETDFLPPHVVDDLTPEQYVPGHVDCGNNTVFDPYTVCKTTTFLWQLTLQHLKMHKVITAAYDIRYFKTFVHVFEMPSAACKFVSGVGEL